MPFQNDEQRKAAFANMGGGRRGGGPRGPSQPRAPKAPKTPKPKKPKPSRAGYAGNYLGGLPDWSNWYTSYENTTQEGSTPLAPYGSGSIAPYGSGSIPAGSFSLTWEDYQGYQPRAMTTAEKILLGIPVAAAMWWAAPGIGLAAAGGLSEASMASVAGTGTAILTTAGTQGGALGFGALSITGIPMSINDAPSYYRDGNVVRNSYPDLVGWLGGQVRNQQHIDYSISASGIEWTLRP